LGVLFKSVQKIHVWLIRDKNISFYGTKVIRSVLCVFVGSGEEPDWL